MDDPKHQDETTLEYVDSQHSIPGGPVEKPEGKVYLTSSAAQTAGVKFAKDGHTILVPQPSNDPNDPLNWSSFKKHLILSIVCFASFLPEYGSATGAVTLQLQAAYVQHFMYKLPQLTITP